MSSVETGQMSAVETRQMSAAETGQMYAVEARQMSNIETGLCPVPILYICLVSTADICPVSAADICPVSTADTCPVSTEDIYPVSAGVLPVEDDIFQTLKTNFASHGRREFCQATPRAEFKTDAALWIPGYGAHTLTTFQEEVCCQTQKGDQGSDLHT